jgi:MFS family permease
LSLAALYVLRMLGLFLILPVLALYAEHLAGATPLLIGLAIGSYGLTQAVLQIPFGMLSDRFGRKRIIVIGLLLFALGSAVAALAESIHGVIVGRALQGAGAIAGAVLALAADLTREESRTKVMAVIGASIGFSFALALVLGPILNAWIGVPGIFWLIAGLALGGIAFTLFVVPQPARSRLHRDTEAVPALFSRVVRDPQLLRLDAGIFILHMLLTASFVALPLVLRDQAGLPAAQHWQLYLPALVLGAALMVPGIILAERKQRMKPVFLGAILVLALSQLGLLLGLADLFAMAVLLVVFFAAFNILEASLPSLIARFAPPDAKGTALGIYSTSQFLGAFAGGAGGGWLHGAFGLSSVFVFTSLSALLWLAIAATMRNPQRLSSYLLNIGVVSETEAQRLARRLRQVPGVAEAVVIAADGVAYLKVDRQRLDESALHSAFSV